MKNKVTKSMLALAMAVTMVASLTACGSSKEEPAPAEKAEVSTEAEAETEAPTDAVSYEDLFVICGNASPDGDSIDTAMDYIVAELNKRTNGSVDGSVATASALGGHADMISAIQIDSMQISEATASVLSSVAPKMACFDIPYLMPNTALSNYEMLSGEVGDILKQDMIDSAGLHVLSWICRTPRHVYSAEKPLATCEDWNGKQIRTMQSTAMTSAMNLLGATPTAIATAERYMALQTGVVEAAENSVAEIYNQAEYEVTHYLSKTGHLCSPNVIYCSESWFQSLSPELQQLLTEIGEEAGKLGTQIESDNEASFEEKLVSEGNMVVNEVDAAEVAKMREKLAPLYEEYEEILGTDLIELLQK